MIFGISGLLSMFVITNYVFRKKIYKQHCIISSVVISIAMFLLFSTLNKGNIVLICLNAAILGICTIPIIPVLMEMAI